MLQDTPNSLGKRLRSVRKKYDCESPQHLEDLFKGKYSVSGILRRESGKIKITSEYVDDLCKVLRIPAYERQQLLSLVGIYQSQFDPWSLNRKGLDNLEFEYLNRVLSSKMYRQYEPLYICAFFQTEDYIYHALKNMGLDSTSALTVAKTRVKLNEEKILNRNKKSVLTKAIFLQDEEALYRIIGSPNVMIKQLEKLQEVLNNKQVELRIVPRMALGNAVLGYNMHIYDDMLVNMETACGMVFVTDPDTVEWVEKTYAGIYDVSVTGDKADRIIKKAIETYKNM